MTMIRWNHPVTGTPITFEDRRLGAKTATPAETKAAEPFRLPLTMQEVAGHEARHAAACPIFGFRTIEARADIPNSKSYGHVVTDHTDEKWDRMRTAELFMTILVGGLGEKGWPPSWPLNPRGAEQDERQLHDLANRLHLTEQQWKGLVDVAEWFVKQPMFKAIEQRIDTLLGLGLTLKHNQLKDIHRAAVDEIRPRTQDELDYAEQVARHRDWMTGVLTAGAEYQQAEADRRAAEDLRRRSLQLAAEYAEPPATKPLVRRTSVFPATITTR